MRILQLTDRLGGLGDAAAHLRSVLQALAAEQQLMLAVGNDDGTTIPPCPFTVLRGLEDPRRGGEGPLGRGERGVLGRALDRLAAQFEPDVIHLHQVLGPEALAWAAKRRAVMTVTDHRLFCPGKRPRQPDGTPCREPMSRARCASCVEHPGYFESVYALTAERLEALRAMVQLIALSEPTRDQLLAAGLAASQVRVVPLIADDAQLRHTLDEVYRAARDG